MLVYIYIVQRSMTCSVSGQFYLIEIK